MYSEPITLRDAVITAIHLKTEDGKVQSRIQVHGSLNQEVADILGAKSLLFAINGTPKEGYSVMRLNTGCASFRATFEADPALKQAFELASGDSTDRYIVERQAEGVLKLKLRLNYHGDPHQALAYITAVGNSESLLRIVPLQTELDEDEDEDEDRPKRNDEYLSEKPVVVPAEAVRQSLIGHRRSARKQATQ
jgi:hypothetical protein